MAHTIQSGYLRDAPAGGSLGPLVVTGDGSASGGLTDAQLRATPVPVDVATANAGAALANVAGSAASVTLLAANTLRQGAMIVNDSAAILFVKFGSAASATSFSVELSARTGTGSAYYEVPFGYTGIITGIWASAVGSARVTEITAA